MKTGDDGFRAAEEPRARTSETTWCRILTRPLGHLLGTIAVMVWVVVCGGTALARPEFQPPLVVVGATPLIIWMSWLSWKFEKERALTFEKDRALSREVTE